jgi:hypothetical protein
MQKCRKSETFSNGFLIATDSSSFITLTMVAYRLLRWLCRFDHTHMTTKPPGIQTIVQTVLSIVATGQVFSCLNA